MPNQWNGPERRKDDRDHDTLITIVQILDNHVKNSTAHEAAFRAHEIQDQTNFEKLKISVQKIERIIWIATGIILAVQALPTAIQVSHILNK